MKTAIAIAAHPDDIEFMMAGTLLLLKDRGYQIHYFNLSCGNVGSIDHDGEETALLRLEEAKEAARILGAQSHPPFCKDLEVYYDDQTLRRVAGIIREVRPSVILTHSPSDYMEDHMVTCRLAVTAAFSRGMPNYRTIPERSAATYDCTIYHALPHTLRDELRRPIIPGAFVNTTSVQPKKMQALKAHKSQQTWLDVSQNMNSYLQAMEDISLSVGRLSGKFTHAEGWRRHLHFGFCSPEADPLKELGDNYMLNDEFERSITTNL